jgi:hypothetical protein
VGWARLEKVRRYKRSLEEIWLDAATNLFVDVP